jgi:hypothetical protein
VATSAHASLSLDVNAHMCRICIYIYTYSYIYAGYVVGVTLLPGLVLHDNETDMAHLPLPCRTGSSTPMTHLYTSPAMWIATPNSTEFFSLYYIL